MSVAEAAAGQRESAVAEAHPPRTTLQQTISVILSYVPQGGGGASNFTT